MCQIIKSSFWFCIQQVLPGPPQLCEYSFVIGINERLTEWICSQGSDVAVETPANLNKYMEAMLSFTTHHSQVRCQVQCLHNVVVLEPDSLTHTCFSFTYIWMLTKLPCMKASAEWKMWTDIVFLSSSWSRPPRSCGEPSSDTRSCPRCPWSWRCPWNTLKRPGPT